MSLRAKRNDKYNRYEDTQYWQTLVADQLDDEHSWYDDWNDDDWAWWDDTYPGYVRSTEQLHQLRVLTLLRKLDIRTARMRTEEFGW